MEREEASRLRRADSSARSSTLTTPLGNELDVGVQHNCNYIHVHGCQVLVR